MLTPSAWHRQREPLMSNWFFCAQNTELAGESSTSALINQHVAPDDLSWVAINQLTPVADALRRSGKWSLDGPFVQFDSQGWWYRLVFDAPSADSSGCTVLGFDGLATLCRVWLNGCDVLASANMFLAHECDVSGLIKQQGNELLMHFSALEPQLAMRRKRPRWRTPMVAHQQLRWFRTTLLGRTPGWSPPAAVVGPWRDIWLEHRCDVVIRDVALQACVDDVGGVLQCKVWLGSAQGSPAEDATIHIARHGRPVGCLTLGVPNNNVHEGSVRLAGVDLWWPHTHGEPALYDLTLHVRMTGNHAATVFELGRVGFRTVTLQSDGANFALQINGVPIFCRGACWTPLDPVTLRSTPEDCRAAVAQARAAGMNMLRLPGTMVYEEDHFYQACDEQGMMVWQDFMFASMDYPAEDPAFAASVSLEARQVLSRLQSAACVVVLCGNSEVEQQAAMGGATDDYWEPPLFNDVLARLCAELVPRTPYWPSSAHGGAFPHQPSSGTTSYYGVGAYLRPLEDTRRSGLMFATECLAFANVPSAATIERMPGGPAIRVHHAAWKARSPRDLGAGWDFDDVRDHYLQTVFGTDPQKLRYVDHERYLSLSRVVTGELMASSFLEWRRPGSTCQGAIVLWLRDLWAGAGWGLLDDAGAPKACYHYLKRVLQPVTVMVSDEGLNGLIIHVLNEGAEDRQLELELTVWRDGDVSVAMGKRSLCVAGRGSQSLSAVELLGYFLDLNNAYRFGPATCDSVVATLTDAAGRQSGQAIPVARDFYFPAGPSIGTSPVFSTGLQAEAFMIDENTATVTVVSRQLSQSIFFDVPGFHADDEYFHLPPGSKTQVTLRGNGSHKVLAGSVHAVNAKSPARIELVAAPHAQHRLRNMS